MAETFEEHRRALEEAVRALESGEEDLERSLEVYEGAVRHLRACHEILARAEERVRVLAESGDGTLEEADYDQPEG
jgi:exodeoxyribonuclease VII small subunit